jgi:hypothetical protein
MRQLVQIDIEDVTPTFQEVLESHGMAGRANLPEKIRTSLESAIQLFRKLAEPRGVFEEIPIADFKAIYDGNERNAPDCPFPNLVLKAHALAIFAATMGSHLAAKSSELFKQGDATLGYMLDAVNTDGAERLGRLMGLKFLEQLPEELRRTHRLKVQYFCPGHCGWHISGQTRLFQALHPEEIGVALNESWVMQPMKSLSGILVVAGIETHRFAPAFSFCKVCKERKCIGRLKLLEKEP